MKQLIHLFCRAFALMLVITTAPAFMISASAYSGGYFDDGLYDDDWYFDYYELPADSGSHLSNQERLREYEADQMYEEAEESGIFNF